MRTYADVRNGKVQDIQHTELDYIKFSAIWDPTTYWVDITDKPGIEIGDICRLNGSEIVFEKEVKPQITSEVTEYRRREKLDFLKTAFEAALETAHIESSLGIIINANESSMGSVNALIALYEDTPDTPIQFCDYYNIFHTVTHKDLLVFRKEIAANIAFLYNQKWKYRDMVEAATSEQEIAKIEFTFTNKSFL